MKYCSISIPEKSPLNRRLQHKSKRKPSTKQESSRQLELFPLPQIKVEVNHPLRIEPLPTALQWGNEERFWLIHSTSGLRVPGTWTADEAEFILDLSKKWDWTVDSDRRVACAVQLMALAATACKRSSSQKGGAK